MQKLIGLYDDVIQTLEFFQQNPPPSFDRLHFSLPFVVGSGNAYNTGLILFSDKAAVFADESNFKQLVNAYQPVIEKKLIQDCVVVSASGEKDSVWEVKLAKEKGLRTTLLTTKPNSPAAKAADTTIAFSSIAEPYTYNVSTYMGMILSATKENPERILNYVRQLVFPASFADYQAYSFVLPDRFQHICPMLDIKKSELFGPYLSLRAFPDGHARHAKFVIRTTDELVISIDRDNHYYGDPGGRWHIKLPSDFSSAALMAITYAIVGKIQDAKPPYYRTHIEAYCTDYGPKAYGKTEPFEVIVPGSNS